MTKLILSFDGGGIRGAATSQFLSRIEDALQQRYEISIRDCADFYAGTSTGSIIALALATTKLSVSEINGLYSYESAKQIFSENKGLFELDGINAPKYEARGKTQVLKAALGDAKIGDVPDDKHVLAMTYALEKREPKVIKSTRSAYLDLPSYKVADASSAAPTYFPTTEVEIGDQEDECWLVDGGVTANNPTMSAIAEAKAVWRDVSVDDFRVLSIGTGYQTKKINGPESKKWGALGWLTKGNLLDLLSDERVVAYQAMTIIKSGNYIRVNSEMKPQPGLPEAPDDAMDDISRTNIKRLKQMGDFWFEQYGESIIEFFMNTYKGASLDRIDDQTGKPIVQCW